MLRRLFRTSVALRKCDKNCSVLVKCSEISNLQLIIDQHYSIYRSLQYHWEFYSLHRDGAVLPPEATITCGPLDSQSLRVIPQLVHVSYQVRYFVPNIQSPQCYISSTVLYCFSMGVLKVDFSQPAKELLATLCELYQVAAAHHMLLYEGAGMCVCEYCSNTHHRKTT